VADPAHHNSESVQHAISPSLLRSGAGLRGAPDLDVAPKGYTLRPDRAGLVALDGSDADDRHQRTRVGVILPVYNESALIPLTFHHVEEFARTHPDFSFLFVDDGSRDNTPEILRSLIARSDIGAQSDHPRVALLAYTPNAGKGHAVKTGVESLASELILFTDGDLAYSLDHLLTLAESLKTHDVVIGSRGLVHRSERNTTMLRRIMGWTFNKCARLMLGLGYSDTQAGLKGFRAKAAHEIFARQRLGGFAFDVEIVYLAKRLGYSIGEIPAYVSEEHSYKRSKVNLFRDPIRMFRALVDVRWNAITRKYGPKRRPSGSNAQRAEGR
jgi:glycosyltransferase involved in cell wall biosynthesis